MARSGERRLKAVLDDITTLEVDAVVNAANAALVSGGGVDGAIHRAAGPRLADECAAIGGCPVGGARVTAGYALPASWVIHTVGPVWRGGGSGEAGLLRACYLSSLQEGRRIGARTVAFPAISTGAYGYPLRKAAEVACSAVTDHISTNSLPEKVMLVCFDDRAYRVFSEEIERAYNT
ncbi:O-acetyl-ADP-ribose deacetylase [Candidatus Fermentibacteria bacterium]|nr:O-acetyl-ADP-ribose deacetylase [Candidatus Fermentibacteria bacterium]